MDPCVPGHYVPGWDDKIMCPVIYTDVLELSTGQSGLLSFPWCELYDRQLHTETHPNWKKTSPK